MKNIIFVLFFVGTYSSMAQTYIPLVAPLNEWILDYKFGTFPQERRKYTFSADSVLIGTHYYHEMIYTSDLGPSGWQSSENFYREDNGKIFYAKEGSVFPESLLYDFDFGIGDTLVPTAAGQSSRTITQVGTTQLLDGVTRKTLTMSTPCGNIKWIEGMGETDTNILFETLIFCSLVDDPSVSSIRCFSTNGQLVYLRPDLASCEISGLESLSLSQLRIYPNPATDHIRIETMGAQTMGAVELFNQVGALALGVQADQSALSLNISSLVPGFYTGKAHLIGGGILVFKLVIE